MRMIGKSNGENIPWVSKIVAHCIKRGMPVHGRVLTASTWFFWNRYLNCLSEHMGFAFLPNIAFLKQVFKLPFWMYGFGLSAKNCLKNVFKQKFLSVFRHGHQTRNYFSYYRRYNNTLWRGTKYQVMSSYKPPNCLFEVINTFFIFHRLHVTHLKQEKKINLLYISKLRRKV